jgi:GT2 family glycosyltransferase
MVNDLFSVIVLHYYQSEFIEQALSSVFKQNYPSIELIVADDNSEDFITADIDKFIKTHKTNNILKYSIIKNTENLGTVKNINNAVKTASGKYLMFFAADDVLYDEDTIAKFQKNLEELPQDQGIITAQCLMFDSKLKKLNGKFVNVEVEQVINKSNNQRQFEHLVTDCRYASGATAYKKETLERLNYFDERYYLIEDWSFYLRAARLGQKISFSDFNALMHREGGVSHYMGNDLPPHQIHLKNDFLAIQENEILPYINTLNMKLKLDVLYNYFAQYHSLRSKVKSKNKSNRLKVVMNNPLTFMFMMFVSIPKIVNKKGINLVRRGIQFLGLLLLLVILVNLPPLLSILSEFPLPHFVYVLTRWLNIAFVYLIIVTIGSLSLLIPLVIAAKVYRIYKVNLY